MPIEEAPPTPPREPVIRFMDWVLVVMMLFVGLAVWSVFHEQKKGEQRGYRNRAVTCDLVEALGLKESPECRIAGVQQYRSPAVSGSSTAGSRNSRATMVVVCKVAKELMIEVPECAAVG